MNYLSLINKFWQLNSEYPIGMSATVVYFYLLKVCNFLGWKKEFRHSDKYIALHLGISINTVRDAKIKHRWCYVNLDSLTVNSIPVREI